jgi:hypothetical protein
MVRCEIQFASASRPAPALAQFVDSLDTSRFGRARISLIEIGYF